ncbi:MAG: hypothetical protein R3D62_04650 [Xanthobacteraceae bacterium]
MPDFKDISSGRELEPTTTTARLPHLDIEITHRRAADGNAEQISINVQAMPSFEAFGRFLESANPWSFWAQAMRLVWFPWLDGANTLNAMMFTPWGLPPALKNFRPDEKPEKPKTRP